MRALTCRIQLDSTHEHVNVDSNSDLSSQLALNVDLGLGGFKSFRPTAAHVHMHYVL